MAASDLTETVAAEATKEFTELDWITLRKDIGAVEEVMRQETAGEKFNRKFKENPLVPVGCALTAGALCYGLYSFTQGNRRMSQNMMRLRIAGQGFTVVALMLGIVKATMQ